MRSLTIKQVCMWGAAIVAFSMLISCSDLNVAPPDQLNTDNFWKNKKEAKAALTALYEMNLDNWDGKRNDLWGAGSFTIAQFTDNARLKPPYQYPYEVERMPLSDPLWRWTYLKVGRVNNFLENIDRVEMEEEEKNEMKAEAKFLRAYGYFLLSQYFGDVPLVTKKLTIQETNSVEQTSREEVEDFVLNELTSSAQDPPATRPKSEDGRIVKAAPLAIKGRLLMARESWSEAAEAWKAIVDLGVHHIDPRFKELFEDESNGNTDEFIWAAHYNEGNGGERVTQVANLPPQFGGWGETWIYKDFVDAFLMKDGKSIEESPLYDPEHPYKNRDPRLYATVFLPNITKFRGQTYKAHPDSIDTGIANPSTPGATGFMVYKFADEDYTGPEKEYGGNYPLIRYAEVLLSYLESKLEAGDNITQTLLDQTINKVRQREAVEMTPVKTTDYTNLNELREIVRRERRVELAFEAGLRYWDIRRWRIAEEVINQKFYGIRITDNPDSYTGKYPINNEGYYFSVEKSFDPSKDYLLPIPQSELDVNDNLKQNPGY